jgi:hypothetical protein
LTPGSSLVFSFDIAATPATMAGDSPFYPTTPIGTSFVYSGAPFSDSGEEFVVSSSTPEPSGIGLLLVGGLGLFYAMSRRSKLRPDNVG